MFTLDEIREIITLIDKSSIQRFELEHEATRIVIAKADARVSADGARLLAGGAQPSAAELPSSTDEVVQPPVEDSQPCDAVCEPSDLYKVTSPLVGTFYSASEPGAAPFVTVGQKVRVDTVVCVLESMKLFNEVEAGRSGEVVEILAGDGDFVEYGQPLFVIRLG